MSFDLTISSNAAYTTTDKNNIRVSILTPVYNRRELLLRTMESVKKQTNKTFEYIIINDGSTENLDDIVCSFMDNTDFPVLYIKKSNGGVHTARNVGIEYAKGEFTIFLDSDDEMMPQAIERFLSVWNEIPLENRHKYREVTCRCVNQNGIPVSLPYPENINSLPWKKAYKINAEIGGEHWALLKTDIMKAHPWPEVEGLKIIAESLIWDQLKEDYYSWYTNDILRIYHTETPDSYTNAAKTKSLEKLFISACNQILKLNYPKARSKNLTVYLKQMLKLCTAMQILKRTKYKEGVLPVELQENKDKFTKILLYIPCFLMSILIESQYL